MMAQLIDRKQLKQEMKELLRSAQVSPRGMTCLYLALVLVLNLADSFMGLMNPGLLGTFISILTGLMSMVLAFGFVMSMDSRFLPSRTGTTLWTTRHCSRARSMASISSNASTTPSICWPAAVIPV